MIERNSMKILKISLGILVVLSLVELVYYFTLVNPLKSLISRDNSTVKKGISSAGDEVLMGDIVSYFRSKKINPGVSYTLLEEIDGYLTKAEISEENGNKYISIHISTAREKRKILNSFAKRLENAGNLFFRLDTSGDKQWIDLQNVKVGVKVKQTIYRTLPEADPLTDTLEIQILE